MREAQWWSRVSPVQKDLVGSVSAVDHRLCGFSAESRKGIVLSVASMGGRNQVRCLAENEIVNLVSTPFPHVSDQGRSIY